MKRPWHAGECGSAIVVVLLVMVALTVFGVLSINHSVVEMQVVQNGKEGRKDLYLSESAALEGIQGIADTDRIDMEEKIAFWHHTRAELLQKQVDFRDSSHWDVDGKGDDNARESLVDDTLYIAAVEWRLATGSSAIVTGPRLYMNRIYGLCVRNNRSSIVEIGYYKRY